MRLKLTAALTASNDWWSIGLDEYCGSVPAEVLSDYIAEVHPTSDELFKRLLDPNATLRKDLDARWKAKFNRTPSEHEIKYLVDYCMKNKK